MIKFNFDEYFVLYKYNTHKFVIWAAQPGMNPGLRKNHKNTMRINKTPTEDSCHVISPSSLYLFSMTVVATRSPCWPMSIAKASLLFGLKRPMYITCSHNHVRKLISSMGGTEYNIQEAKFMPGLSGKRLEKNGRKSYIVLSERRLNFKRDRVKIGKRKHCT